MSSVIGLRTALAAHWAVALMCALRLLLGLFYSVAIPLWEAFDEDQHFAYIRYVVSTRGLPREDDPTLERIREKFQPPLYYVLGAASVGWIDMADGPLLVENPFFEAGTGGVNRAIHGEWESLPYAGAVLGAHVVRVLSVGLSLVGVVLTYLTGLALTPGRKDVAIGAVAIHAFWPQFLFSGSTITNDILASVAGSALTLVVVRIVLRRSGAAGPVLAGALLAVGLFSKLNALSFLPIAIVVVVWEGLRRADSVGPKGRIYWWGSAAAGCALTAGAWLVLTSMEQIRVPVVGASSRGGMAAGMGGAVEGLAGYLNWALLQDTLAYAFRSFFALFGWGNLAVQPVLYHAYAAGVATAGAGLLVFHLRRRDGTSLAGVVLLEGVSLAAVALVVALSILSHWGGLAPGRYLLPAMSAVSILLFVGWRALWGLVTRISLVPVVCAVMVALGAALPFISIIPAYAAPPRLSEGDLLGIERRLSYTFDDKIQLLGYDLSRGEVKLGQSVVITLYWRALADMEEDHVVCVRAVGPEWEIDGADCSYPGRGNYATSLWKLGDSIADHYRIRVPSDLPVPSFVRINVAVFPYRGDDNLRVTDSQGGVAELSATFGRIKVAARDQELPMIDKPVLFRLGQGIGLIGYELADMSSSGQERKITLYWECTTPVPDDYTVFVHVVDPSGQIVAQHDAQPRGNRYPTSLWSEGEIIVDEHHVALPQAPGEVDYQIQVGMYRADTGQRLLVFDDKGIRQPDDAVPLRRERT